MTARVTTEAEAIDAAHPLETGRHDLYADAMRLVGERHAKGDLVDLVTWLLTRAVNAEGRAEEMQRVIASLLGSQDVGHGREYALAHDCLCRWCKAHRFVPDSLRLPGWKP